MIFPGTVMFWEMKDSVTKDTNEYWLDQSGAMDKSGHVEI